jgi:hypothetical protein
MREGIREMVREFMSMFSFCRHQYGAVKGTFHTIYWFVCTYAKVVYCHYKGHKKGEGPEEDMCVRCGELLKSEPAVPDVIKKKIKPHYIFEYYNRY